MDVSASDLLVQELAHAPLELGRNLLWLVRHMQLRNCLTAIRFRETSQHPDERGLARTILSQHDNDLGVAEASSLNGQLEVAQSLGHGRVRLDALAGQLALLNALRHLKCQLDVTEAQILRWYKPSQEDVNPFPDTEGHGDHSVRTGLAVQHAHEVGQIIQYTQVVLHHNHVFVNSAQFADGARRLQPLSHVQVRRGLVEHVNISILNADDSDRKALQLSTRQVFDGALADIHQVECCGHFLDVVSLIFALHNADHGAFHSFGDVIHVLWLDDGLDVVLEEFCEEVLELTASEVEQDLFPSRRRLKSPQVGLEFAGQNFESG
mmetsp:Transcript_6980/g.7817  ORF Transcript_6980/g.7817 Transcript_6980/m.7817 type:complete len:322 (+) Transcript_6980:839-1804(+)